MYLLYFFCQWIRIAKEESLCLFHFYILECNTMPSKNTEYIICWNAKAVPKDTLKTHEHNYLRSSHFLCAVILNINQSLFLAKELMQNSKEFSQRNWKLNLIGTTLMFLWNLAIKTNSLTNIHVYPLKIPWS